MEEQQQYKLICKQEFARIDCHFKKLFKILEGNGGDGLITKVARHDERIKSLQSWKKWAIAFGTSLILAILIYIITRNVG